jgi:periplasmic copper chaperone A
MRFLALAAALATSVVLSGCGQEKQLYVSGGWVNLPAVPTNPGAAYFTVHGGPTEDRLLRVNTEVTLKTELHESMKHDGAMTMKPLESVAIPAGGTVTFAPGGKHVMLIGIQRQLKRGETLRLDFTFASGEQIYIDVPVLNPGEMPSKK